MEIPLPVCVSKRRRKIYNKKPSTAINIYPSHEKDFTFVFKS